MEHLVKAKTLAHNFEQVVPPDVIRFLDFACLIPVPAQRVQ